MDTEKVVPRINNSLFNTPLEIGLRALIILSECESSEFDIQRLVYYDYLLLHSSDFKDGPPSIHPGTPHRSGELLIRREILQQGVALMQSRGLLKKVFHPTGIRYSPTAIAKPFLTYFESDYFQDLCSRAEWVHRQFEKWTDEELSKFMNTNLDKWGAEFSREALFHENREFK